MRSRTDIKRTLSELDNQIDRKLDAQVLDESRADHGGYFSEELGFASPSHVGTSSFLRQIGLAYLTEGSAYYEDEEILHRVNLAANFQRRCQRDSGRIDIPQTNFDSPPDTAFSVSQLVPVARLATTSDADESGQIGDVLRPYLVSAANGIAGAGFHTPNHRWVIVDALSQVSSLYSDQDFEDEIERYLAEGIDINEDGEYSERSNGVYNAVTNTHLIRTAEALGRPSLLKPVRENLHYMADMLRDDWTIVTSFSRRQDQGRRTVPTNAADSFYYMGRCDDNERFKTVAYELLDRGGWPETLLEFFARYPDWGEYSLSPGTLDTEFTRVMEDAGIWRIREGKLTAALATETTNALEVSYGELLMAGFRIHAPYFAGALFEGTDIDFHDSGATLAMTSDFLLEQLPGYWQPMDRTVEWEELPYETLDERSVDKRPEFDVLLNVNRTGTEFDVNVKTEGGLPGVPFVVECRFSDPDHIEIDGTIVSAPSGDEPVYHGSGDLTVRKGGNAITLSGGFLTHRQTAAPPADDTGEILRVVMTEWSPVDRTIQLRCHDWSPDEDDRTARGPAHMFAESGPER